MEIHPSALKHGVDPDAIRHAVDNAIVWADLDPDSEPPKVLAIGPGPAGNLLEVILLELHDERQLAIHAMALRPIFIRLLEGLDTP